MLVTQSLAHSAPTQAQPLPHALLVLLVPTAHTILTVHGLNNRVFARRVCTLKQVPTCALNAQLAANA